MHTVRLLLKTTEYDKQVIDKRFRAIAHIHNITVKRAKYLLRKLEVDKEYQVCLSEYKEINKKNKLSSTDKKRKAELSKQMSTMRLDLELSEYGLQSYIKICGKQFSKYLSSQQIQKEATRVWKGVEKVLFDKGENIHYKKRSNFTTISGKTNTNGVKFDKESLSIEWIGLNIKCKLPKKSKDYILESLDNDISYCEIERKMFPNGWHYYAIVYLKGDAPKKMNIATSSDNITGLDIGTSSVATVSDTKMTLRELAPKCKDYNKKIQKLQYHMDISKRNTNPHKYNANGTVKKNNKEPWVFSKTYLKNRCKLRSLYRQKSAYIKQSHEEYCNELIKDSVNFIVETINFKALQKKSKNIERSNKASNVKQKDGSVKQIYKFKKKKRFGKSLNNRAPALLIATLERKCNQYGGQLQKVNTQKFRASQYDHTIDDYIKKDLSERIFKLADGSEVQRDLYSAFLLKNSNTKLDAPDRLKCLYEFNRFLDMQNKLIETMKQDNISMKTCFGF